MQHAEQSFREKHPELCLKIHTNKKNQESIPLDSIEYELQFILQQGQKGFPILNALIKTHERALQKTLLSIDEHTAKTPFLALVPLFLFQMPSLMLIFIYPIATDFFKALK